jgi:hypothetical protein
MNRADDTERQRRFRRLKLRALVRDHGGRELSDGGDAVFPPGAALVNGEEAWVLLEDQPERALGAALAWAIRQPGVDAVHVLAERGTGLLARRAAAFAVPLHVWHVEGRDLLPAVVEPLAASAPARIDHEALIPVIVAGGAEPVVEHGVVTGEVRGLEVCRVVDDPVSGAVRLEVGVGAHDREAFAIIHGDVPTADALRGVVAAVAAHRRPGAGEHPVSRLVPERLLRWSLIQDPSPLGLVALEAAPPPTPRPNVKDRLSCSAHGRRADGTEVVVVCSVGVDLDVIPYAADARLAAAGGSGDEPGVDGEADTMVETMVVAPRRDLVAITSELVAALRHPVRLVAAPGT